MDAFAVDPKRLEDDWTDPFQRAVPRPQIATPSEQSDHVTTARQVDCTHVRVLAAPVQLVGCTAQAASVDEDSLPTRERALDPHPVVARAARHDGALDFP